MRQNLEKSLELIFGHEGGYVNVKTDRGGPTKFGITYRTLGNWQARPACDRRRGEDPLGSPKLPPSSGRSTPIPSPSTTYRSGSTTASWTML